LVATLRGNLPQITPFVVSFDKLRTGPSTSSGQALRQAQDRLRPSQSERLVRRDGPGACGLAAKYAKVHHVESFSREEPMSKLIMMIAALATMATVGLASAQQPAGTGTTPSMAPIKRTLLQKVDVPGSNYETVTGIAEIDHPERQRGPPIRTGPETGYVLEGKLTLLVDGKPPQTLKPGDSYQVPPVTVHDARSGDKGAKIMAVYIVEKGKPLASPAP